MSTFPTSRRSNRGYKIEQVDEFLVRAREAYDGDGDLDALSAEEIRQAAFNLRRRGYETHAVDAALERLEDAFAERERQRLRAEIGEEQWLRDAKSTAQVIINRLNRPDGNRFSRTGFLARGYNRKEVDRIARRLIRYFRDGKPMSVKEVRSAVFRQQRRGYSEVQVDLLFDSVADVMLAVS